MVVVVVVAVAASRGRGREGGSDSELAGRRGLKSQAGRRVLGCHSYARAAHLADFPYLSLTFAGPVRSIVRRDSPSERANIHPTQRPDASNIEEHMPTICASYAHHRPIIGPPYAACTIANPQLPRAAHMRRERGSPARLPSWIPPPPAAAPYMSSASPTTASQEEAARAQLPLGYRDHCSASVSSPLPSSSFFDPGSPLVSRAPNFFLILN